jgi:hypothetical protein
VADFLGDGFEFFGHGPGRNGMKSYSLVYDLETGRSVARQLGNNQRAERQPVH